MRKITGSSSADGFTSLTGKTGQSEIGCHRRGASNSYLYGINECCHQLLSLHRGEGGFQCYYGFTVDLGLLGVEGLSEVGDPRYLRACVFR